MNNKKLKNLIKLNSKVAIYVPSTIDVDKKTDNRDYINNTLTLLSRLFGGATSTKAVGCWQSKNAGLVKENVEYCFSYCNQAKLEKAINEIINYCEKLKKDMKQENISLEVNNDLYFI